MSSSDQFISGLNAASTALAEAVGHKHFQFRTHQQAVTAFEHIDDLLTNLHTAAHRIVDGLLRKRWEVEENGGSVDQSFEEAKSAMGEVRMHTNISARRAAKALNAAEAMTYPKPTKKK